MADPAEAGEIVNRALSYPYAVPDRSFLALGGRALELPEAGPDLRGREALLAYGANAAPEALARKLAPLPDVELPVLRAELEGFDVVYSAHVSPYGAVPATLHPSPGSAVAVFVAYPTAEQRRLLSATEPNYEPVVLRDLACRVQGGALVAEADAFLSRHGRLTIGGAEVALGAVRARGRTRASLRQPEILKRVRAHLAPHLDLERFVASMVESGGFSPLPDLPA